MVVNSSHPNYGSALPEWLRVRDVLAGEDAAKAEPRNICRGWIRSRGMSVRRTESGYVGLIFRRPPFVALSGPPPADPWPGPKPRQRQRPWPTSSRSRSYSSRPCKADGRVWRPARPAMGLPRKKSSKSGTANWC